LPRALVGPQVILVEPDQSGDVRDFLFRPVPDLVRPGLAAKSDEVGGLNPLFLHLSRSLGAEHGGGDERREEGDD
jgi:hypothetical protein